MKIRLDDVMQSFSYPFDAVYYYYIPLETVLMFVNGKIYGKAVHGIASLTDVAERSSDFIKLPDIGDRGRKKVMMGFAAAMSDTNTRQRLEQAADDASGRGFESVLREEKLLMPWFNYRDEIYREFSKRWCEENALELIV